MTTQPTYSNSPASRLPTRLSLFIAGLLLSLNAYGQPRLNLAVASNFAEPAKALAQRFETEHPFLVAISLGATGKLYSQIRHGAPFDVLMAANQAHPKQLEQDGLALANSRRTYAIGALSLWLPKANEKPSLASFNRIERLAIANAKLAPYGLAAEQFLHTLASWPRLQPQLVRGENIGQTFQFAYSGAVTAALIARSQSRNLPASQLWHIPSNRHSPIEQQLVALNNKAATLAWLRFMQQPSSQQLITEFGYLSQTDESG